MTGTIVVFARRPEPGQVKTRLAKVLGDEAALDLHRAFLADTLTAARQTGRRVVLARTAGPLCPEDALADDVMIQRGNSFGARFDDALAQVSATFPGPIVLIGSDTPHLSPADLARAFSALEDADVAVGPAPRNGFHLLGFRGPPVAVAAVFDATDEVTALLDLFTRLHLRHALVPPCRDLDEIEDLWALAAAPSGEWDPGNTRAALDRWLHTRTTPENPEG